MAESREPASRFYQSQGLQLHYADWGNPTAPPLVLIHGSRDHCRSWDSVARALQPHFHVLAPDLRGHGDSEWARGSSYSLADHLYDVAGLLQAEAIDVATVVGHSLGGMIGLAFAGTYPHKVSRLVVLDGAFLPSPPAIPIDQQIAAWVAQLDGISNANARSFRTLDEAAERMSAHNRRLTPEQALHLARHGVRKNQDGSFSWKFDKYQQVRAPYRLSAEDYIALWSRIACPTLLLFGDESFLSGPDRTGLLRHFSQAEAKTIAGAGHWLHHDRLDDVVAALRSFLEIGGRIE
ncbi:alpha/beta hydrolase [Rhodopseudomonas palustris]|uniref:Alpha/beta hydrolase n=1 Tax=Rhodopseudomonas palustris TaxID=1076 RepID=A0A0D7EE70_RHOPL|nr:MULTISPECIES: alpha/beta hydrolase [Rhodopseudomonas]KIZ39139.1 alpha/beta hydrolase [Rhodopseudomonas palustris]MDF3813606.1 alpha/beta hydrolase [Rhodopseudomonas sp. BAL398]